MSLCSSSKHFFCTFSDKSPQYQKFEKPTEVTEKAVAEIFRNNAEFHNQEDEESSTLLTPKKEKNLKRQFATEYNEDAHDGLADVSTSDGTITIVFKN